MLEITAPDSENGVPTQSLSMQPVEGEEPTKHSSKKPAIFMTGATHARELISTSINMFKAVQLIQQGVINKDKTYQEFLKNNKYYFVPILNVDGVALIEQGWEKDHKIIPVRKNRDPVMAAGSDAKSLAQAPAETQGVDLNRNFAVQFGDSTGHPTFTEDNWIAKAERKKAEASGEESLTMISDEKDVYASDTQQSQKQTTADPRSMFYNGQAPFSEPESQAYKNFLTKH